MTNVVEVTLGPRGRTVVFDKKFGSPLSTKDAVMVAKQIEFEDARGWCGSRTPQRLWPCPAIVSGIKRASLWFDETALGGIRFG